MSRLRLAVIVEGHGEVAAVPILVRRIWGDLLQAEHVQVLQPIRIKRSAARKREEIKRAVGLAVAKLKADRETSDPSAVLVLMDRDPDPTPPCELGPQLYSWFQADFAHVDAACVIANTEFETWFVAAAESLIKYLVLPAGEVLPNDPEHQRCGKKWISDRFRGVKYSETQDQPAMTSAMDLRTCRQRSPSFDKLCRELEKLL